MENQKKLTPQELQAEIEREFHESNKLWGEIAKAYADVSLKLFDDTIKFVYQALTAMGIVAGFGFTGIQGVENMLLFIFGEGFMFASMMFGLYRIKVIYVQNSDSVDKKSQQIKEVYEKKAIALGEMMKELQTKGKLSEKTNIQKYEEANKEILETFGIGKERKKEKDESWFITVMIALFIVGFGFLLLSFLPPLC